MPAVGNEWYEGNVQTTINGEEIGDDSINGPGANKRVWGAFYDTESGEQFLDEYYDDPANQKKLLEVFIKLYPDQKLTVSRLLDAYNTAFAAGEFVETPQPATPIVRDESGQFANALDIEVKRLAAENPAEINRRARIDRQFAAAVDRVMYPKGPATNVLTQADPSLREFVAEFRRTPNPRFLNGVVRIGTEELTPSELENKINQASAAGLL
jgi:hypothetical protein